MQITTDRLILRDFVPSDWQAVRAYQSDARYLRYYAWTERPPEAVQAFIQMFLDHQYAQPRIKFQLATVLKSNQQFIGLVILIVVFKMLIAVIVLALYESFAWQEA